jgi:hypothetical protein
MNQADVLFIIGISGLAIYAKSQVLYGGTFIGLAIWGYQLSMDSWIHSMPVLILAGWMIFKALGGR